MLEKSDALDLTRAESQCLRCAGAAGEPTGASGSLMERLSFEDLASEAASYDDAVLRSEGLDRFCSSSLWILPAIHHLMPPATPHVFRSGDAYLVLARSRQHAVSDLLHPLEALWGLPCPLVGPEPRSVVDLLVRVFTGREPWELALVTGLTPDSRLFRELVSVSTRYFRLARGPTTRRYLADLTEGYAGFLRRRSPAFRKNLRKAERRAAARGVRFEIADSGEGGDADTRFDRLLAVERRSWKGIRGVGIDREPMCSFYREIHRRLVCRGLDRLMFATMDGEDVAYIFGGVFGDTYRGLQFSFDSRFSDLSLGNLCQAEEIRRSCGSALRRYDLGAEVPYKRRWGERTLTTVSLILRR